MLRKELEILIIDTVKEVTGKSLKEVELFHPSNREYGDYSSNIALKLKTKSEKTKERYARFLRKGTNQSSKLNKYNTPMEIASAIAEEVKSQLSKVKSVERIEVVKPGFINVYLSEDFLVKELGKVLKQEDKYGQSGINKGKKLMVEYAHPNTHKDFHIGHLRNIILGESLCLLFEASGAKVIRTNYQGDVGLHVAKTLWGFLQQVQNSNLKTQKLEKKSLEDRMKLLGEAYVAGNKAYEEDEEAKKEIIKINISIYEKSDPKINKLWEKTRKWSLDYFASIYKRLGTKFDRLYFESEVAEPGTKAAKEALKKGILEESDGAVIFKGDTHDVDTRVFLTKQGIPTYEGKELGLAHLEFTEFGKIDKNIHVVAPEQTSFFKTTFKAEELLNPKKYKGKQEHFAYGYVRLKEGKMSSRRGTLLRGEDILDKATEMAGKIGKEESSKPEDIGVAAVKYSMLKGDPRKDIQFSFEESVSLEGNSGPYLQYTYARARSVIRRANVSQVKGQLSKVETGEEEEELLRTLYIFPEVVEEAAREYAPHKVCTYLFELAQKFNSFYEKCPIVTAADTDTKNLRLTLTSATAQIIKNGLSLLGISAPEKM